MVAYDRAFFEVVRQGAKDSAAVVVPLVQATVQARTVIDVGCGEGWWGKAFARCPGVLGVTYVDHPDTPCDTSTFRPHDLRHALPVAKLGRFDLAVCLEVAEHLPARRAPGLVAELCTLAPVILFSAAIPGQGGHGHVNEQPPAYWCELFKRQGFAVSGALRFELWDDGRVENWYRQNLLVAANDTAGLREWFDSKLAKPWHLVHPVLWDARR